MNDSNIAKIAILGATGHIGKNLVSYFSQEENCELFLFSREKTKAGKLFNKILNHHHFSVNTYENFNNFEYDVIINCVGISDPEEIQYNGSKILSISECYDNMVLDYLQKRVSTLYVNISSGLVYGSDFTVPVNDSSYSKLNINHVDPAHFYSITKIYSEAKHRAYAELNIVDLRIFGFFSRFIDLNGRFFMSELAASIKDKKKLITSKDDFIRDFVHPSDLILLIKKCMLKKSINDAFDVYSISPTSKSKILDSVSQKYGLEYVISDNGSFLSSGGIKPNYYSESKKAGTIGYKPQFLSIDTILTELKFILN